LTGLNSTAVIQAAIDHLSTLGLFETVQGHEALSAPGNGLTADVWVDDIHPVAEQSGLNITSAMLTLFARIYLPATTQPTDAIDPAITAAVDALMTAYTAALTLDGLSTNIDLLGQHGVAMNAKAGYVDVGGQMFRCMTITIPCLIDDVWPQAP
jgi:hypothetical protein